MNFKHTLTHLPFVIVVCFIIDLGLCSAYFINDLIGRPYVKMAAILDLDGEDSLSAWYSTVKFFCIFILGFIFAYYNINKDNRSFLLFFFPVIFLLMSIDESVQIHEWLGVRSDILLPDGSRHETPFQTTGIWMFLFGLPFLALFLLWAYSIKYYFDKPSSFKRLIVGMITMLSGALGFELLSNFVENTLYITMFEEGLEMIGATIILWSVYDMTVEYLPGINQKIV